MIARIRPGTEVRSVGAPADLDGLVL
jgi:hypothetical protein